MRLSLLLLAILILSCSKTESEFTAQQIINKSIKASGTDKVSQSKIAFTFRDKGYSATRNNGQFEFTRSYDSIKDVLSNSGFMRFIHGEQVVLTDSVANNYKNSVNSVHYFSVLPFGLNDTAVQKKILPSIVIKGQPYYKIEVRFSEEGGGEDFEDVFVYWVHQKSFLIHYLAYEFHTNGGGFRFREVTSEEIIAGIRFVNYANYKPNKQITDVKIIDSLFIADNLNKVSDIILKNIQVTKL